MDIKYTTMKSWDVIDYLKENQKFELAFRIEKEVEQHVCLSGLLYKVEDLKNIIPSSIFRDMETVVTQYSKK